MKVKGADTIRVKGARENNLKNIDVEIPKNSLVVLTGVSGSGKSSLAFDTIYAEGQRRYVESLSAYARQFLGNTEKPDVDSIEGLSPAISIDQKTTSKNPRSTVATVTEIYDYLRLLYARVGTPVCPNHHIAIQSQTTRTMVDKIMSYDERTKLQILAPVIDGRKGTHKKLLEELERSGYVRARINGEIYDLADNIELDKNKKHTIDVVVDRLTIKEGIEARVMDSLEKALELGHHNVKVDIVGIEELTFSENFACPLCGFTVPELEPRLFSFNSPFGACATCEGLGSHLEVDPDLLVPDKTRSVYDDGIQGFKVSTGTYYAAIIKALEDHYGYDYRKPIEKLSKKEYSVLFYGTGNTSIHQEFISESGSHRVRNEPFEGICQNFERRYRETTSDYIRTWIEGFMRQTDCKTCQGLRLSEQALSVKVGDISIAQMTQMSVKDLDAYVKAIELSDHERSIAKMILAEIHDRLEFLINVGLDYLTLSRTAGSLSGGESQRIRLATQIGSKLTGVLYVLDEPSIGLHQKDNDKLIETLKGMRDLGNTLIVVEHDEDTMRASDYLVDIGPGAGIHGGEVVSHGTPEEVMQDATSLTGRYLAHTEEIEVPKKRRKQTPDVLSIRGAKENNLKNVSVDIPLHNFVAVTGVSGSGKSTLINQILLKALMQKLYRSKEKPGAHKEIRGLEHIDKVVNIDQSPIGRTPRSNPVTYTGVFDSIRDLYASTTDAKMLGYEKGRFSFNVKGGRCEHCRGDGVIKIEMHFLPDVYVPCEVCKGKRYNKETLEVKYKGKSIYDILEMTITEGVEFFQNIPRIASKLQTLEDVGLGYIKLGQPATTLSGGEAQRVKLASELQKRPTGKSIYILDEPTTGLHIHDVKKLLSVLHRIVDHGDTILVIEHNLDVIKTSDYIIDLGPEGGDKGGTVLVSGTPEKVARHKTSYTGAYLKQYL